MSERFIKHTSKGLYCTAGDFYLDPSKPSHRAVVSHAHADHAVPGNGRVFCTSPTARMMEMRYGSKAGSQFEEMSFRDTFEIGPVKITLFPAAHMLGSAQILMEHQGKRYLYTGDFKIQNDPTAEPFEYVPCDVLITETTFADPSCKHPDPQTEIAKLSECKGNILIGAYALGKAQRITALLSKCLPDKNIMVHSQPAAYHRLYEKFGIPLGKWIQYDRKTLNQTDNNVYVVAPYVYGKYSGNPKFIKAFATGWSKPFFKGDVLLKVSDHADWDDLLTLIQKTNPSSILTVHGNGKHLKDHFSGKRIHVQSAAEF
jgi:putative mRNA 3-end processing factor